MKLPASVLFFIISVFPLTAQSPFLNPSSPDIITDFLFLQSLHPRHAGSANEKRVIRFIEDRLTLLRLSSVKTDFSKAAGGHSFSLIIEASIPGRSKDTVLIIIPLNHSLEASSLNDGSFGIALGLRLLAEFRVQHPTLTLKVVFIGAEYEGIGDTFPGTDQFLRTFYPVERHMVLYLDLKTFPAACTVHYGGRGTVAPLWLVNGAIESFRAAGLPFTVQTGRLPVFRSGLATADSPLDDFLKTGYPALLFQTSGAATAEVDLPASADRFVASLAGLTESFGERLPAEWDRHYIFLSVPFLPLVIVSETVYLVFILGFMFVLVVVVMFRLPQVKKYAATLKRNFWNIPFFLVASFGILLASGFLLDLMLVVRNFPTLWPHIPVVFFVFTLCFFFFAAALLFRIARRFPFSKNGSFYSAAALFFIVASILIVVMINISFIRYLLWPLVCVILFALSRSRKIKLVFLLLFPLPILLVLFDLFSLPELRVCDIIIFNKLAGNLLFAVVILPFALLLIRIRLLFPYRRRSILASRSFLFMAVSLIAAVSAAVVMFLFFPYDKSHPQPVLAEQIIDVDRRTHTLSLSSPAPLGEIQIVDKNGVLPLRTTERTYFLPLSGVQNYLDYTTSVTRFTNRMNIDLQLRFRGEPFKIRALLGSDGDFKLYDSNFPVEQISGKQYALSVGMNPPPDLLLQLTLPLERTYTLSLEAYYINRSSDVDIHGDDIALDHRLMFRRTLSLQL